MGAVTELRVLWGSDSPRCCLVRARPRTDRWHQIRKHLSRESYPILGDSSHGDTRENRAWRERGMLAERYALHMHRLEIVVPHAERGNESLPNVATVTVRDILPNGGLDVYCALPNDLASLVELTPWAA